ncbi:MAG: hypothetical protein IJ713_06145, partial [Oscillibacter sp.]|nr:hypothetical protein [Oscillibacter sp.]
MTTICAFVLAERTKGTACRRAGSLTVDKQILNCFLPELCFGKNTLRRSRSAALAPTNEAKAEAMERAYFPWKPNEVGSMLYAALPFG